MFIYIFLLNLVALKICFADSVISVLFCGIAAYTAQHIAYQLFTFLINVSGLAESLSFGLYSNDIVDISSLIPLFILYVACFYLVYWVSYVIFARQIKSNSVIIIKNVQLLFLVFVFIIVSVVINAVVTYEAYSHSNVVFVSMSSLLSIICCSLSLVFQFEVLFEKKLQDDLVFARQLIRQEQIQYAQSKSNIDLINIKCHDLKKQIRLIATESPSNEDYLKKIENAVNIYDLNFKTGNTVLDTILTEKSLECTQKNIKVSCLIDGGRLSFMDDIDLYTLFGNVFDNAIEAVENLDEPKRVINLTYKIKGNLLSIVIRNYCNVKPVFKDGLPQTTKEDKLYHGYGMKSIKSIVDQYSGQLSVMVDDNVFTLCLMFELAQ